MNMAAWTAALNCDGFTPAIISRLSVIAEYVTTLGKETLVAVSGAQEYGSTLATAASRICFQDIPRSISTIDGRLRPVSDS
jgi:hypothetical protein